MNTVVNIGEFEKPKSIIETSPLIYARVGGALYLLLAVLGIFGVLFVPSTLIVPGDAAATAQNIMASASALRLSIVSALLVQVVNIIVVLVLYRLLKPVNKDMAALMVIFLLVGVPIAMLNELNRLAILLLAGGAASSTLMAMVPLLLDLHKGGIMIAGIFWGLWLFPMGYLVFKSGFLPKILGVLLMVGCIGYLIDSTTFLLFPGFSVTISQFTFIGEILLPLWLLIKGVNVEQWKKRSLESA